MLLEADTAWSQVPETWQERVDNFGLLQMDIAWCLLQLENLHALPDAATRISRTEKVLMTQVNPNFLKLAIMHAEEGRAVPPLAAPFVRLLLLKGVIKPWECKLFGEVCNPENPVGALMVSSEGSCSAYYQYAGMRAKALRAEARITAS